MKNKLIQSARKAQTNAYAPYSKFKVGAAVLTSSNEIFSGCNVENHSYSLTCCAERVAIYQAVAHGLREIKAIAIVGHTVEPIRPCGACLQVMAEFFTKETVIYLINQDHRIQSVSIDDLLPSPFVIE